MKKFALVILCCMISTQSYGMDYSGRRKHSNITCSVPGALVTYLAGHQVAVIIPSNLIDNDGLSGQINAAVVHIITQTGTEGFVLDSIKITADKLVINEEEYPIEMPFKR